MGHEEHPTEHGQPHVLEGESQTHAQLDILCSRDTRKEKQISFPGSYPADSMADTQAD